MGFYSSFEIWILIFGFCMVTIVVGTQWGDEGKGKIIDILASNADVVARFQGGANAGHTIKRKDKTFVFHQIPSGALSPTAILIIGNGCCIDPETLVTEIEELNKEGIDVKGRLFISENAHVVMPAHKEIDAKDSYIGTTKRGIGPCYEAKYGRRGIRMHNLLDKKGLINPRLPERSGGQETPTMDKLLSSGEMLRPYIRDTSIFLNSLIDENKNVLIEGAQGGLLDIDYGTYPFCTSSNTIAGGACTGLGIGPTRIDSVIGVAKAYTSRVGEGPFPIEFPLSLENKIREIGGEFGATTGRPRKVGWFDASLVSYIVKINNIDKLAITKLDVLDTLPAIKICKGYKYKGKERYGPFSPSYLLSDVDCEAQAKPEPVYEELPGWCETTTKIRKYKDLPLNARRYIERIAELVGAKVFLVSIGPGREETIEVGSRK